MFNILILSKLLNLRFKKIITCFIWESKGLNIRNRKERFKNHLENKLNIKWRVQSQTSKIPEINHIHAFFFYIIIYIE